VTNLAGIKSVVIVFAMDGCPACADYQPRFARMVELFQQHGQPLVLYQIGMPLMPGQIPVVILDGASDDESVATLADGHNIEAMPTTLLLRTTAKPLKIEGAVDDQQIYAALASACLANR
jgi:hypothetical protein